MVIAYVIDIGLENIVKFYCVKKVAISTVIVLKELAIVQKVGLEVIVKLEVFNMEKFKTLWFSVNQVG
jgi:hypothetical protein